MKISFKSTRGELVPLNEKELARLIGQAEYLLLEESPVNKTTVTVVSLQQTANGVEYGTEVLYSDSAPAAVKTAIAWMTTDHPKPCYVKI